jgi:protein phosphatase
VYSKSKENEFQGMGATLDLLIKKGNTGYLFHAGDSAVYVLEKNNNFRKITTDDTYVESLYRRGKISRGMTYTHPLKSELQNAIGINAELELACISVDLSNVKYILMVSDGISSYLIEEEIEEVLKDNSDSASKVRQLFEKRKNPSSMAEIYKRTSPRHAKKELSEICEDISNKDDATAILIQNSKED